MKTLQGSILQVAVVLALATCLALSPSCKNGGNTNSTTDTLAMDTMSTMKADTMKTDTMAVVTTKKADSTIAPLAKKTHGEAVVSEPIPAPVGVIVEDKEHVYNHAEVEPVFPGGQSTMDDYVNKNIRYPQKAIDNGTEGKVTVQFVVDENGKVSHVTTLGKPLGDGLEEEAMRVMSGSPVWIPGKVKGQKVKTYVVIPIVFKLQ